MKTRRLQFGYGMRVRSGDPRRFTLFEVIMAMAVLAIATVGVMGAFQQATTVSQDANLNQELHTFAEAVLEQSEQTALSGPTGLFTLAGSSGLIFSAPEGSAKNMVAVLRCDNNPASKYEVDVTQFGLPPSTSVRVVRVHVQAMFVGNPGAASPATFIPLTGPEIPRPYNLVGYRIVQ